MNVALEKGEKLSAKMTVTIDKADYLNKVDESLKKLRRNVQMHGFRPGNVPMGLVKKMYGSSVRAEEVNKLLQKAIEDFIKEQNLDIVGDPMISPDAQAIDFEKEPEQIVIPFDVALAPELDVKLNGKHTLPYYNIEVTDEMVTERVNNYAARAGKQEKVDTCQEGDLVRGVLTQLDAEGNPAENGISRENVSLLPQTMKDDAQKALFVGAKTDDVITFNPHKALAGSPGEMGFVLGIDKEIAKDVTSDFTFQIKEILRHVPGAVNQELFDSVFGKDKVKTEEEFRSKIKEAVEKNLATESDYRFLLDLRTKMLSKVGKPEYDEELLKRMFMQNAGKDAKEPTAEEFDKLIESLTWSLIQNQMLKAYDVKLEEQDVREAAKRGVRTEFVRYGMDYVPEEIIDSYAKEMMQKEDQLKRYVEMASMEKLVQILKEKVKLDEKKVSIEEFNKLFD